MFCNIFPLSQVKLKVRQYTRYSIHINIAPFKAAGNVVVMIDVQVTFFWSHRLSLPVLHFTLFNIRKTWQFLTQHATQLLVQGIAISRIDYSNALSIDVLMSMAKPVQMSIWSSTNQSRSTSRHWATLQSTCSPKTIYALFLYYLFPYSLPLHSLVLLVVNPTHTREFRAVR